MPKSLKKTILLVEDEALLAMNEKMQLEKYGYSVRTVNTGEKAVALIDDTPGIDLVLMDIDLGKGIDGTQAAEIILKGHDIPILFVSSHTERDVVEKTERITNYGYVVKNSSLTVLDASIKMAFKLFDANKSIRNSETKQKTMISNISDVIGIIGLDGIIKYKSPNIEKWFGWKSEDLIGTDSWLTVHPDDLERIRKDLITLFAHDGSSINVECRYKCKDGSYKSVELTATNLVNDPSINGILLNYHDISGREQAAKQLQENEERYRTLFESMPIGVFYFQPDGMIKFANAAAEDILGIPIDEIVNRSPGDHRWRNIHEDGSEFQKELLPSAIAMRTGKAVRNVTIGIFNQRENSYRWVRASAIPQFRAGAVAPYQVYITMDDITERKKIEGLSKNNEELYRTILQTTMDGYWLTDTLGNILDVNEAYCKMSGYTKNELLTMRIDDIIIAESENEVAKRVQRVRLYGSERFNSSHHRKDGSTLSVEVSIHFLPIDSNRIVSFFRDITERKQIESKLHFNQEKHQLMIKNSSDAIVLINADGEQFYISDASTRDTGFDVEELKGPIEKVIYPEDLSIVLKAWEDIVTKKEEIVRVQYRHKHKYKPYIWYEAVAQNFLDNPVINAVIVNVRDITATKNLEFELRKANEKIIESESMFKTIFDRSVVSIAIVRMDKKFTQFNNEFCIFTGYARDELLSMKISDITHPDDMEIGNTELGKLIEGKIESSKFEKRYIHKSGKTIWGEINVCLITETINRPSYFLATIVDITYRKKAEEEIKSLLSEKEIILKEVHHRIKNNYNTISSLLSLHAQSINDPSEITVLEDTARRVRSLMMLYEKLYMSSLFTEMPVKDYISPLADEIVGNFPNRPIVEIEEHIEDFVLDARRLQPLGIILNELLTNIMKYAFAGRGKGRILISATCVDGHALIAVQDDGVGIPESISFESSPGFGLQLIQGLTQQLNGEIFIERGNGTKIVLKFEV